MSEGLALEGLAGALAALAAALLGAGVPRHPRVRALWARYCAELEAELRYQGSRWTGRRLAILQLALGSSCVAAIALHGGGLPCAALLLIAYGPRHGLAARRRARTDRIEAQLDGFLVALAHSLRATPALGDGLRSSAEVLEPPIADELRIVLDEHDLGTSLDRALLHMAERVRSPVVSSALSSLRIARSTGGDFVQTLERGASALREMARLEGVVRTKTAEGRTQTAVVSLLPIPMVALIDHLSPGLLDPLFHTDAGHLVLAACCGMWLVAFLAARRIAQVDI